MPENRLARTRAAYESSDPMNRLARIYMKHAKGLLSMGQMHDAMKAIEESARILGAEPELQQMKDAYKTLGVEL